MTTGAEYVVSAYVKKHYVLLYIVVIVALFLWYLWESKDVFYAANSFSTANPGWWHQDIPWLLIATVAWSFNLITIKDRKQVLLKVLITDTGLYEIDGSPFSGLWNLRKKPQYLQPYWVIMVILVVILWGMYFFMTWDVFFIHYHFHVTDRIKENTVMGLGLCMILSSNLLRFFIYRKYCYEIQLKQQDRWLSLAVKSLPPQK